MQDLQDLVKHTEVATKTLQTAAHPSAYGILRC